MEVRPFRAYRFNKDVVGDVGNCIAPPYDVITDEQREQLYRKSKYNIVRVIKGETKPSDNGTDNQYTRAARYLNEWIEQGALKQDSADTIYGYVQDFRLGGTSYRRLSFIALAKLEEFGPVVRPHEEVLNGPIVDRLNLKRATGAKFGLVFMLYEDKQGIADRIIEQAAEGEPLVDFVDDEGVRHRLFAITDKEQIDTISRLMGDKKCIIADGHHRYTTGLTYSKENPNPAAKYQMIAFVNTCHEGLAILATHRVVANLEDFNLTTLLGRLKENFELTEYRFNSPEQKHEAKQRMLDQMKVEHDKGRNAFGIYAGDNAFYVAVLKNVEAMNQAATDKSHAWRSLDVAVLQKLILEQLLGIDERKLARGTNVEYVKDNGNKVDEIIEQIDTGQKQVAFFMNPPKMEQIERVADMGERMPQKSTYFYPKIYTGLTINKL